MPLTRFSVTVLALSLTGCAANMAKAAASCATDGDCREPGQVCFQNGCGNPTQGLVAEVTGDPLSAQYAQDFACTAGATASMDFEIRGPLVLTGEFQRELTAVVDPTNRVTYTDPVVVRAIGESELIPGVSRSFEAQFDSTERGVYSMNMGAGKFVVTALPLDPSVPPDTHTDISVKWADAKSPEVVNFAFPSVDGAVTISGRLLKKRVSVTPPVELALTQVAMDLQAFDPATRLALSQRIPVSSGLAGSRGDFILTMSPAARSLSSIILIASPRVAGAMVPTKTFSVQAPLPATLTLEMGDFGEPLPQVPGEIVNGVPRAAKLVASDGQPLVGASVLISGMVVGGGQFRSKIAVTDASGNFALDLLANDPSLPFMMQVVPPPDSRAAATQVPVRIVQGNQGTTLSPPVVTLADRLTVSGTLYQPDFAQPVPAQNVRVRAVEQVAAQDRELPLEDVEGVTDQNGLYTLSLDPGTWTLEFLPGGALPRTSRVIIVDAKDENGNLRTSVPLPDYYLSKGLLISGQVTASSAQRNNAIVPYATVRFFHVAPVAGKPSAVLMATGTTDEKGRYTVVLPTRAPPDAGVNGP